jgi:hypothetical protein
METLPSTTFSELHSCSISDNRQPAERPLGRVACWVDDNVAGGKELTGNADVPDVTPTLTIIDSGVSAGSHFVSLFAHLFIRKLTIKVECMLQGEPGVTSPPFKILGM